MKAALRRIFLKNGIILLVILGLFAFFKYSSTGQRPITHKYLEEWVAQCAGATDDQIDALVEEISARSAADQNYAEAVGEDFKLFTQSYGNRRTVSGWISFAKDGQGSGASLPNDIDAHREFYRSLSQPWILDEEPMDVYAEYQKLDIVSILVSLLSIVFWGMHYEMEIYRFTDTVRDGRAYTATLRTVLLVLSLGMLVMGELADLRCSGLLDYTLFWQAPVQSHATFRNARLGGNMLQVFTLLWIGKGINTVLLCALAELVARKCKAVKDSTITVFLILLGLMFVSKALIGSDWFSVIQLGAVNWINVLKKTILVGSGAVSSTLLGLVLLLLVTAFAVLMQWTPPYRGIRRFTG